MNVKSGIAVAAALILVIIGLVVYNQSKTDEVTTELADTTSNSDSETEQVRVFSASEVSKHNSEQDCWLIISGSVYDVTEFIATHPGGKEILRGCGQDATTLFTTRTTEEGETVGSGTPHSSSATSQLETFKIGTLQE